MYINVDRSMRRREITWTNHIQIGKMQVFVVASDSSMSLKMVHGTKKVAGIGKPQLRLSSSPHKSNTQSIFMIYSYHNSPVRADDLWIKFADLWVLGNRPVKCEDLWVLGNRTVKCEDLWVLGNRTGKCEDLWVLGNRPLKFEDTDGNRAEKL